MTGMAAARRARPARAALLLGCFAHALAAAALLHALTPRVLERQGSLLTLAFAACALLAGTLLFAGALLAGVPGRILRRAVMAALLPGMAASAWLLPGLLRAGLWSFAAAPLAVLALGCAGLVAGARAGS